MLRKELGDWLFDHFPEREHRATLITLAQSVRRGASWPDPTINCVRTFFSEMLNVLSGGVKTSELPIIFNEWGNHFQAHPLFLTIGNAFENQPEGVDFDSVLEQCQTGAVIISANNQDIHSHLTIQHPHELFGEVAIRTNALEQLRTLTLERDIIFVLGGVGSGKAELLNQFRNSTSACCCTITDSFCRIDDVRDSTGRIMEKTFQELLDARKLSALPSLGECSKRMMISIKMKCLVTVLAYHCFVYLAEDKEIASVAAKPGISVRNLAIFADYYFSHNNGQLINAADVEEIFDYFFASLHNAANGLANSDLVVFMPWAYLSDCFKYQAGDLSRTVTREFFEGLGKYILKRIRRNSSTPRRVCLIICCDEAPYARITSHNKHILQSIWPIPPINETEISCLLRKVNASLDTPDVSSSVLRETGGIPWLVQLLLSYVQVNLTYVLSSKLSSQEFISRCSSTALGILVNPDPPLVEPFKSFITGRRDRVTKSLNQTHVDDPDITANWLYSSSSRRDYTIGSHRLEAFIASGLTWIDEWSNGATRDHAFSHYPVVALKPPGVIAKNLFHHIRHNIINTGAL